MEFGKLPTDNLYKFLALSGLFAALYCSYTGHQLRRERFDKLLEFWVQEDARTEKLHSSQAPWTPAVYPFEQLLLMLDPEFDTEDDTERNMWFASVDNLIEINRQNRELPVKEDIEKYFARSYVKDAFMNHKDMTAEEYEAYAKAMTLEEFTKLTEENREFAEVHRSTLDQHKATVRRLWRWVDQARAEITLLHREFIASLSLAAFGFCLWYWKVQRCEDAVLLQKALETPGNGLNETLLSRFLRYIDSWLLPWKKDMNDENHSANPRGRNRR